MRRGIGRSDRDQSVTLRRIGDQAPRRSLRSGTEIVAIFIGSSTCGASNYPGLASAVATIRSGLRMAAVRRGAQFSMIGAALDWSVSEGLKFLESFGPFDEVTVGRNWINGAATSYMLREFPGQMSLPQLVVVERTIGVGQTAIQVGEDRFIMRRVGFDALFELARKYDSTRTSPQAPSPSG